MVACGSRLIVLLGLWLAGVGQVEPSRSTQTASVTLHTNDHRPVEEQVVVDRLEIYDQANEQSYLMGTLSHGDRVRVRGVLAGGWVAIDPPPTAIGWVVRSALDLSDETAAARSHNSLPTRAAGSRRTRHGPIGMPRGQTSRPAVGSATARGTGEAG